MSIQILTTLNLEQSASLVMAMKDLAKDFPWDDATEEDVDAMSDEELIRGINIHYSGGITQFIADSNIPY